jgi:hypothetical protein
MASSWGLGKRSRGRYRLLGWAVAGLLLPATGLAQVAPPINYEAATIDTPAGPLDNMVATLFFAGLGVTIR